LISKIWKRFSAISKLSVDELQPVTSSEITILLDNGDNILQNLFEKEDIRAPVNTVYRMHLPKYVYGWYRTKVS
jgi:hypothetical protein